LAKYQHHAEGQQQHNQKPLHTHSHTHAHSHPPAHT